MSDETTLLSCPICGKKVSIARTENEVGERWWFITRGTYRTTRCNCRLFLESEKFTCGWNDDYSLECRAKLIDKWNTRAELGSVDCECYLMRDGEKFPVELDYGFIGLMPIAIKVAGFRYLLEVPDGKELA